MTRILCSLFLLMLAAAPAAPELPAQTAGSPPDIDAYIGRALKTFEVPGMALSFVKHDPEPAGKCGQGTDADIGMNGMGRRHGERGQ